MRKPRGRRVDFWDLTKLLVRRWYVAVPLLLLTAVSAVGLAATIKPDYVADSYITMVPPTTAQSNTQAVTRTNPWLNVGLTTLGAAAIYSTQDANVVERMVSQGYSDNFTLALDGNSPIIKMEVTATNRDQAKATVDELAQLLSQSVRELQAQYQTPQDQLITMNRLDRGDNIKSSTTKLKRAVIAIVGAGLLMSIAFTAIFDAILQRRARRKARPADVAPPRASRAERVANGSVPDHLSTLRDRDTELVPSSGVEKRPSGGFRPPQRDPGGRDAASETAVFTTTSDDTAVAPMPSDATIILPLPDKEPWVARDGRGNGNNRGGSSRR
jgi:capsular polysaccharide biosynthesis protein